MVALRPLFRLGLKTAGYRLARAGLRRPPHPSVLTFSITNRRMACTANEACERGPSDSQNELTVGEIDRIFRSIGPLFLLSLTGGEPFLRDDVQHVVGLACKFLRPALLHISTEGLAPDRVDDGVSKCLASIERDSPDTLLTVRPVFDGLRAGSAFELLIESVDRLRRIARRDCHLRLDVCALASRANLDSMAEIEGFAEGLGVHHFSGAVAAPDTKPGEESRLRPDECERLMGDLASGARSRLCGARRLARLGAAVRLVYYEYARRIEHEKRQVLPCLAGIANAHLAPQGDLWPCSTLEGGNPMGNVREADCNFGAVWRSARARAARRLIRRGACACPLAEQVYSNIACSPRALLKVIRIALFARPHAGGSR